MLFGQLIILINIESVNIQEMEYSQIEELFEKRTI